ncbi:MORN repeat-containing protein [Flavivirga rizhaonensis]|uniref:MORN repeat protein n=1 Tax=Flavivirga rizhaonensis TaxID=2559571 RepID=A0A4S1E461_9FLAO|nr:hypothetical protein [Flavivirga rizhaonensis]TGV04878.1 hypothetical protein EM932_01785 [Flavivirga rizhaonensis]
MKRLIILMGLLLQIVSLQAQDCKVMLKTINEDYTGDCKNGKADGTGIAKGIDSYTGQFKKGWPNGDGIYTWSNGNSFEGIFKKGKKEGQGKMTYKTNTLKDSVVTGFWKKDTYVGLFEKPYKKIDKSQNVTGLNFTKTKGATNNIRLYVRKNRSQVSYPEFNVVLHHGTFQNLNILSDFIELTNVTFPIKVRATSGQDFIEFEILESGNWEVRIAIEEIQGLSTNN